MAKKLPRQKLFLQVDNRERCAEILQKLNDYKENGFKYKGKLIDFDFSYEQLPIGDYVCGDVVFERKFKDLASSLTDPDSRLLDQADAMYTAFKHRFILNVGDMFENAPNIRATALIGLQESLAIRKGVYIINVPNNLMVPFAVINGALKAHDGKVSEPVRVFSDHHCYTKEEVVASAICRIPGIGPERAKTLMDAFGIARLGDIDKLLDHELYTSLHEAGELPGIGEVVWSKLVEYI